MFDDFSRSGVSTLFPSVATVECGLLPPWSCRGDVSDVLYKQPQLFREYTVPYALRARLESCFERKQRRALILVIIHEELV
jgi:hypothetical protein